VARHQKLSKLTPAAKSQRSAFRFRQREVRVIESVPVPRGEERFDAGALLVLQSLQR
jgi:hypothetical protein